MLWPDFYTFRDKNPCISHNKGICRVFLLLCSIALVLSLKRNVSKFPALHMHNKNRSRTFPVSSCNPPRSGLPDWISGSAPVSLFFYPVFPGIGSFPLHPAALRTLPVRSGSSPLLNRMQSVLPTVSVCIRATKVSTGGYTNQGNKFVFASPWVITGSNGVSICIPRHASH